MAEVFLHASPAGLHDWRRWRARVALAWGGYGWALAVYFAVAAAIAAPFWLRGEVISPDRQTAQLGLPSSPLPGRVENRFFNDYSAVFIPEVSVHLHGKRSGWLATWDPYNELGRPLYHDAGVSPAYLPTWVLGWFTDDPLRLYTWHSLLTLLVGGVFAFLFVRGMELHPVAALTAALFLSLTPVVVYWLSFPLFHAVLAWACGAIYCVSRLSRRPDMTAWTLLAFCIYSLLMAGYQQDVVANAYLLTAFGLHALVATWRRQGSHAALRLAAACGSAVAVGLACAAPAYLDLLLRSGESARVHVDPTFFLANLPVVDSLPTLLHFVASYFFQELFGNPIVPHAAYDTGGMTLQPVFLGLILVGAVARFRQAWGWCLAIAIGFIAALCHPVYLFAVEHLGFDLSFSNPIYTAHIPMMVMVAYGADFLCSRRWREPGSRLVRYAGVAVGASAILLSGAVALRLAMAQGVHVQWVFLWLAIAALACLLASLRMRAGIFLTALLLSVVYLNARPLVLSEPPRAIAWTSPLVEAIRRNLPADGRFAVVGALPALGSNINASLALPSVHTYNSLSSRRYQALVARLGGSTRIYGRHNDAIGRDFDGVDFALAGIALIVSPAPIVDAHLVPVAVEPGANVYRVRGFGGCCLRFPDTGASAGGTTVDRVDDADRVSIRKLADQGDRLEFGVRPAPTPSVLALSQAYHPQWRAIADIPGGTRAVDVFPVNGFFMGVRVPAQATGLRLQFRPWVRFSWIGNAFFLLMLAAIAVATFARRLRSRLRPGAAQLHEVVETR